MHFPQHELAGRSHDHGPYQFHSMVNATSHASFETLDHHSWGSVIDPSLRHFQQDEYGRPTTGVLVSQKTPGTYHHPSSAHVAPYNTFAATNDFHQLPQSDWSGAYDAAQLERYTSPAGPYGGSLSESSSEYAMSPENTRASMAYSNSPPEQSFQFAPLSSEVQFRQQPRWPSHNNFASLPTPPVETNAHTQAIAMKEIFQGPSDFNLEPHVHEDSAFTLQISLPMPSPEELELSEDIATPAPSSRANTFSSRSTENDVSENDYSVRDHDSDSDFDPRQIQPGRHVAGGHVHNRNMSNVRPHRRTSTGMAHPVMRANSRVAKISRPGRNPSMPKERRQKPSSSFPSKRPSSENSPTADKASKSFPCTFHAFGCASRFANKNEWKRHVTSQHLQLGFFRCDLGGCNPDSNPGPVNSIVPTPKSRASGKMKTERHEEEEEEEREVTYNDFNRKDLFTQHCRRMHGPLRHGTDNSTLTNQRINERVRKTQLTPMGKSKTKLSATKEDDAAFEVELDTIRARCWTVRRKAPIRSSCGFCGRLFQADIQHGDASVEEEDGKAEERAWEERMEHIGKHYEKDHCSPELESTDDDLRDWGLQVGVLESMVDSSGTERVWLVNYATPSTDDENVQSRTEEEQVLGSREVQRRKGLRKRPASNVPQHRSDVPIRTTWPPALKEEASDSEMDADAEVE